MYILFLYGLSFCGLLILSPHLFISSLVSFLILGCFMCPPNCGTNIFLFSMLLYRHLLPPFCLCLFLWVSTGHSPLWRSESPCRVSSLLEVELRSSGLMASTCAQWAILWAQPYFLIGTAFWSHSVQISWLVLSTWNNVEPSGKSLNEGLSSSGWPVGMPLGNCTDCMNWPGKTQLCGQHCSVVRSHIVREYRNQDACVQPSSSPHYACDVTSCFSSLPPETPWTDGL